jgi:hypothetical protein
MVMPVWPSIKKGVCPNPRGRPKKQSPSWTDSILKVLSAKTEYHERGRVLSASRQELAIKHHIAAALNGDLCSAAMLLKLRRDAEKHGRPGPFIVDIIGSPESTRRTPRASDSPFD